MQAIRVPTRFLSALALSASALAVPAPAQAQGNPEIANCVELKDVAIVPVADLCAAHVGCRFVLGAQKTCARAKDFLERLQAQIGEGSRTFFGTRKEVTPDAIFTAVLNGEEFSRARNLETLPEVKRQALEIATQVRNASGDVTTGSYDKVSWIYYGNYKEGGWGTLIDSNGKIMRGRLQTSDIIWPEGQRFIGTPITQFATVSKTGAMMTARRVNDFLEGKKYRQDGTLEEEGRFESNSPFYDVENNKLLVGTKYDTNGVRSEVNLPAEREAVEKARLAADVERRRKRDEETRLAAEAEQQRKRDEAARVEQQFQASLPTMSPGQLFARADELKAQGENARAREVQRALISRFPNHPLAVEAARQMSGDPTPQGSADSLRTVSERGSAGTLSPQQCEAMKRVVIATKVPPSASITAANETVMFMTKAVLDMIAAGCPTEPGVTPAQIEAERKLRQQQYAAAESACNAVQSGGRRCIPQLHSGTTVPSPPPPPAAPSREVTVSYDPVRGICTPAGHPACADAAGGRSSSRSSGGGIRTAR